MRVYYLYLSYINFIFVNLMKVGFFYMVENIGNIFEVKIIIVYFNDYY